MKITKVVKLTKEQKDKHSKKYQPNDKLRKELDSQLELQNARRLAKRRGRTPQKVIEKQAMGEILRNKGTRPKGMYYNKPSNPLEGILKGVGEPNTVDTAQEEAHDEHRIQYFGGSLDA